jgi:hypothetical protein
MCRGDYGLDKETASGGGGVFTRAGGRTLDKIGEFQRNYIDFRKGCVKASPFPSLPFPTDADFLAVAVAQPDAVQRKKLGNRRDAQCGDLVLQTRRGLRQLLKAFQRRLTQFRHHVSVVGTDADDDKVFTIFRLRSVALTNSITIEHDQFVVCDDVSA